MAEESVVSQENILNESKKPQYAFRMKPEEVEDIWSLKETDRISKLSHILSIPDIHKSFKNEVIVQFHLDNLEEFRRKRFTPTQAAVSVGILEKALLGSKIDLAAQGLRESLKEAITLGYLGHRESTILLEYSRVSFFRYFNLFSFCLYHEREREELHSDLSIHQVVPTCSMDGASPIPEARFRIQWKRAELKIKGPTSSSPLSLNHSEQAPPTFQKKTSNNDDMLTTRNIPLIPCTVDSLVAAGLDETSASNVLSQLKSLEAKLLEKLEKIPVNISNYFLKFFYEDVGMGLTDIVRSSFDYFLILVDSVPSVFWLSIGSLLIAVLVSLLIGLLFVWRAKSSSCRRGISFPPSPVSFSLDKLEDYKTPGALVLNDDSSIQLLVICCPVSGCSEGIEVYEKLVRPMLKKARVRFDPVFLDRGSHAYDTAVEFDIHAYTGVVVIGGDKVLHEFLNGLSHRDDCSFFEILKRLSFAVVPTGNRNAFATSLGLMNPFQATDRLIKSILKFPSQGSLDNFAQTIVDLYSVRRSPCKENENDEVSGNLKKTPPIVYDFYFSSWGLLADISLSSERTFPLSFAIPRSVRNYLSAVWVILRLRPKQGSITLVNELNESKTIQGDFTCVCVCKTNCLSRTCFIKNSSGKMVNGLEDGRMLVLVIRHCSRWNAWRTWLTLVFGGDLGDYSWVSLYSCRELRLANESGELDICSSFGEEELGSRDDSKSSSLIHFEVHPRVLRMMV